MPSFSNWTLTSLTTRMLANLVGAEALVPVRSTQRKQEVDTALRGDIGIRRPPGGVESTRNATPCCRSQLRAGSELDLLHKLSS